MFSWLADWVLDPVMDMFLTAFTGVVNLIVIGITGFIDMFITPMNKLIFDTSPIITQDMWDNSFASSVTVTFKLAAYILVIGITIYGYKLSYSGLKENNPTARTLLIELVFDYFIISFVLLNIEYFYTMLFSVNESFVNLIHSGISEVTGDSFVDNLSDIASSAADSDKWQEWGFNIVASLVECGAGLWLNFYFLIRRITIIIALLTGPVFIALWLIPSMKQSTYTWMKELIGTVMIQSLFAFTYMIMAFVIKGDVESDGSGSMQSLIMMCLIIPVTEGLKGYFNMMMGLQDSLFKKGAMLGVSTAAIAVGKTMDYYGQVRNNDGYKDTNGLPTKDTKEDEAASKQPTSYADRMISKGQQFSKFGSTAFSIGGAVMAAGTGNAINTGIGMAVGSKIGSAVGGITGRSTQAITDLAKKSNDQSMEAVHELGKPKSLDEVGNTIAEDMSVADFNQWKKQNPDSDIKNSLREQFPHASESDLDRYVAKRNNDKKESLTNSAKSDINEASSGRYKNTRDILDNAENAFAKQYETENKSAFLNELPNSFSDDEKEKKWNQHLSSTTADFKNNAIAAAKKSGAMPNTYKDINGNSMMDSSYIDSNEFSSNLNTELQNSDNQDIKSFAKSPTNTDAISYSLQSIPGSSLVAKNGAVNKALLSGIAMNSFMKENPNISQESLEQSMEIQDAYFDTAIPGKVERNNRATIGQIAKTYSANALGVQTSKDLISSVGNNTKASLSTIKGEFSNNKITQSTDLNSAANRTWNAVTTASQVSSVIASSTGNTVKHTLQNADSIEGQHNFNSSVAYAGGLLTGKGGYIKASNFATKINPYNESVNKQVMEIKEIANVVPKQMNEATHEMEIKRGSVQLVTTPSSSFIQVKDVAGTSYKVSQMGSGNINIPEGKKVYRDLNITNGMLAEYKNDSGYMLDSTGGKITTSYSATLSDANRLLANKQKQIQLPSVPTSFNSQVDSNRFFIEDARKNDISDIKMIIDTNKSYLVGKTRNNEIVRLSSEFEGNINLGANQQIVRNCKIRENRITIEKNDDTTQTFLENGQIFNAKNQIDLSNFEPNKFINNKPNPRLENRKMISDREVGSPLFLEV